MLNINGIELDFDITSPEDLRRYRAAGEKMAAAELPDPPHPGEALTDADMEQYIAYLEAQCRLLTDFIDEAFGGDVCNRLLGPKTSLDKLLSLCDALGAAVEEQSKSVGVKIVRYAPNRASRRSK